MFWKLFICRSFQNNFDVFRTLNKLEPKSHSGGEKVCMKILHSLLKLERNKRNLFEACTYTFRIISGRGKWPKMRYHRTTKFRLIHIERIEKNYEIKILGGFVSRVKYKQGCEAKNKISTFSLHLWPWKINIWFWPSFNFNVKNFWLLVFCVLKTKQRKRGLFTAFGLQLPVSYIFKKIESRKGKKSSWTAEKNPTKFNFSFSF